MVCRYYSILILTPVLDIHGDKIVTLVYLSGMKLYTRLRPPKKPVQFDEFMANSDEEEPDAEYTDSHAGDDAEDDIEARTPLAGRTRNAKGKAKSIDPFTLMGTPTRTKTQTANEEQGKGMSAGFQSFNIRLPTAIGTKRATPFDDGTGTPKRRRESAGASGASVPPAKQTTMVGVFDGSSTDNTMSAVPQTTTGAPPSVPMEYYPAPALNTPMEYPHHGMWGYGAPGTFNGVPSMHPGPSNPPAHPNSYPYNPQFDTGRYWGYGPPQSYPHPLYPYPNQGAASGGPAGVPSNPAIEEAKHP